MPDETIIPRTEKYGIAMGKGGGHIIQVEVADLKFLVPSPESPAPRAELKVINAGKTKFPGGRRARGWRDEERPSRSTSKCFVTLTSVSVPEMKTESNE